MINTSRIVPVSKTDLLTLYGNMIKLAGTSINKVSADAPGVFNMTSGSGNVIADEPVKTFNFGSDVSSAVVYFIADYDYTGFSIDGTAEETAGVDVVADGNTLYTATLASGDITIAKVGF